MCPFCNPRLRINVVMRCFVGTLAWVGGVSAADSYEANESTVSPPATPATDTSNHAAADTAVDSQPAEEPRIIEAAPNVFVLVGYDVANVVVVATSEGNVVIDTGSCDDRAQQMREAIRLRAPGPTRAIIYTHHQIEQTGGGGIWAVEPDIPIWATDAMPKEFVQQYMLLDGAELRRGIRQFGLSLPESLRIPSALGRNPEPSSLDKLPAVRLPTQTFHGETEFAVGEITFQLLEAPGETKDQLMVWIPSLEVLVAGDNFIRGFPEVHHLRGAPLRQPEGWIATLDRMRALAPGCLISARHEPISGRKEIRAALVDYRDALQWLRNETLRAINRGDSIDHAAQSIMLPAHLAESPFLIERTGCVERAVRAIFTSYAGWFDERPETLYPCNEQTAAHREITMMGGAEAVLPPPRQARSEGDYRWALHLLAKLREDDAAASGAWREEYASALEGLSSKVADSSGASYLASMANELTSAPKPRETVACPDDETIRQIPLEGYLEMMSLRLKTERVLDVHETVVVYITDEERQFNVTIRRGIVEIDDGTPLPEMPQPVAILVTDGLTFRKMCMGVILPVVALASGELEIRGNRLAALRFSRRFECERRFEKPEASPDITLSAGSG